MSFGLAKSSRLLNASEFTAVFRYSQINLSTGPLRTRAIQNRMLGARLGLVVPKKGTAKAFRRNRIKRLVRESFRHHASSLPNVDIVIQVFDGENEAQLQRTLDTHFDQIRKKLA